MKHYVILKNDELLRTQPVHIGFSCVRDTINELKQRYPDDKFSQEPYDHDKHYLELDSSCRPLDEGNMEYTKPLDTSSSSFGNRRFPSSNDIY